MKTVLTTHLLLCIMLFPVLGEAQLFTISGNVTNSENGKALENVSIFESKSNTGTITNNKGFFKLELLAGDLEISITDVGYKASNRNFVLKADTTINIKLSPEIQIKNRHKKQMVLHADAKTPKKSLERTK
jgi:hypothetical protein